MRLRTTGEGRQGPLLQRQPCVGQRLIYTDRLSSWSLGPSSFNGQEQGAAVSGGHGRWGWQPVAMVGVQVFCGIAWGIGSSLTTGSA